MRQGSVIHELYNDRLLIFREIKVLKLVGPKEGPEVFREALCIDSCR